MYVYKQFVPDKELFELKGPFQVAIIERSGCLSLFGETWDVQKTKHQSIFEAKGIVDLTVAELSKERNYNSALAILHDGKTIYVVKPSTDWGDKLRLPD